MCHFKHLYLAIDMVEISEIFSTSLKSSILQDPTVTCVQKWVLITNFLFVLEMAILKHFDKT